MTTTDAKDSVSPDGRRDERTLRGLNYPYIEEECPPPGEVLQIAEGVYWVRMPLPISLQWINLWLIEDDDGWTIVDTGMGTETTREHWRSIFESVLGDKPVTRVVVTHMHPDHIGLAGWITRKFGARLAMSRLEYVTCRMLVSDTGREAPEAGIEFYQKAGWQQHQVETYKTKFGGFGRVVSRLPDSYDRLEDGDVLTIGGSDWKIITGCGHSPQHVCLFNAEKNLLISGDQLLPRISSNVSVHPTEPEEDPLTDWIESCDKLITAVPEDVLVLPAHNLPFRGAHVRLAALIEGHEKSLVRLHERLDTPRTVPQCFVTLFGRKVGDDILSLATGETIAHLNCLRARGMAERTSGPDGVDLYSAL